MNEIYALGLHAMQADAIRVREVGMNLANVLTSGYQRGITVQPPSGARFDALMRSGSAADAAQPTTHLDRRSGALQATGAPLDLALASPGYFEVLTDDGPAYTRQGRFQRDALGRLVTAQGHVVMGLSGDIRLPSERPVIGASGAVTWPDASGVPTQLRVVDFPAGVPLARRGDGLIVPGAGVTPVPLAPDQVHIRQGWLERSNVDTATEMRRLMEAVRHFESLQKVLSGYDDMLGTAIRRLGDNP